MGPERPGDQRLATPDRRGERLAVAVPQHLAPPDPPPGAPDQARQPDPNRQIEPDDGIGRVEDERPELALIATVDHPPVGRHDWLEACTELVVRHLRPAGAVHERVQLDELHVEAPRELAAECRLAVPARTRYDGAPPHVTRTRCLPDVPTGTAPGSGVPATA